jgi:hypothetical protein
MTAPKLFLDFGMNQKEPAGTYPEIPASYADID